MTVAVYAALSIQFYLFFLGKSHFGNIYIYNKLIAYVMRKNISTRFQSHRVNTAPFENVKKNPSLKLTGEKIRLFPERSAE